MKKIERVEIHNFQSHTDTTLQLAPLLTTIVGASDAGKSSIIRAIRWALFNEPAGTQYMRIGTQDTYVRLIFNDGSELLRARDKTKNYYILQEPNKEPIRFEGFGVKVPEEVFQFTGIRKVPISEKDTLSLNLSSQLEGPFLLGESPTVRAESIGRLAGTYKVDMAHRIARADRNQNTRQINQLNAEEATLNEQLLQYAHLDEMEQRIRQLTHYQVQIDEKKRLMAPIRQLKDRWTNVGEQTALLRRRLHAYRMLDEASEKLKNAEITVARNMKLSRVRKRYVEMLRDTQSTEAMNNRSTNFLAFIKKTELPKKLGRYQSTQQFKKRWQNNKDETMELVRYLKIPVMELQEREDRISTQFQRLTKLVTLRDQTKDTEKRLSIGKGYLESWKRTASASDLIDQLQEKDRKRRVLLDLRTKWKNQELAIRESTKRCHQLEESLDKVSHEYLHAFQETGRCPYCLQTVDNEALSHIKSHLEKR